MLTRELRHAIAVEVVDQAGLLVWGVLLLAIGIRTVHTWSWPRALAATSPLALLLALGLARAHGLV